MAETKITAIEGNRQKLDGGAMFGNAPKAMWERWIDPDEKNRIELACRAMLIETEGKKLLFEAGVGAFFEPKLADRFGIESPEKHLLLENLGIDEGEIDFVVLSHLHFDHAGGILPTFHEMQSKDWQLHFPNAKYIVGKDAWERANTPHPRDKASFVPAMLEKLEASGRLQIVDGPIAKGVFEDRLRFFLSDGHTPGQMLSIFTGNKKTIVFAGDLIPGLAWVHLPITMGYDRYPELLIDEKNDLLSKAEREKWLLFFTHEPGAPVCEVEKNEKGRFAPKNAIDKVSGYSI